MTTNDRIHDQGFCYDDQLPPSVPEGEPLRCSRPPREREREANRLRRSYRATIGSLRGRIDRD